MFLSLHNYFPLSIQYNETVSVIMHAIQKPFTEKPFVKRLQISEHAFVTKRPYTASCITIIYMLPGWSRITSASVFIYRLHHSNTLTHLLYAWHITFVPGKVDCYSFPFLPACLNRNATNFSLYGYFHCTDFQLFLIVIIVMLGLF